MRWALLGIVWTTLVVASSFAKELRPSVEIEEEVYSYEGANNGAGPMWCAGSTSLVRVGNRVFATGLETLRDVEPLNNCRWTLFERRETGWARCHEDTGRTREPSPMAAFHDGSIFVSANPTTTPRDTYGGPATPELWKFSTKEASMKNNRLLPVWKGSPRFSEHSYRSLAADGSAGELVLFQNIGYNHAEWTFRDAEGKWSAQGQLRWPLGTEYEKEKPIRLCYPNVALKNRAVHFFGVADITEPVPAWQKHKRELTGNQWDYVFRRLYYAWTPDIAQKPFCEWIEIANREPTAGHLWPCDLWIAPDHKVHILWTERALDERLREKFFPHAKQSSALKYAVLQKGKTILKKSLFESSEDLPAVVPSRARFHISAEDRLFVVTSESESGKCRNRLAEIREDGALGSPVQVPLKRAFSNFFTTTPRAGSKASDTLEMLGPLVGGRNKIHYARISLFK